MLAFMKRIMGKTWRTLHKLLDKKQNLLVKLFSKKPQVSKLSQISKPNSLKYLTIKIK